MESPYIVIGFENAIAPLLSLELTTLGELTHARTPGLTAVVLVGANSFPLHA